MTRPTFKPSKRVPDGSTKAVIKHLYERAGGAKNVAFALGLATSRTYQLHEEGSLTLDDAASLTFLTGSTEAAEYLATLAGGTFVPVEADTSPINLLLARSATEHGEVMARAMRAIADGDMDASECGSLASEIDDVIRVMVAARQKVTTMIGWHD